MKFIATTSEKIDSISAEVGQLIFSVDDKVFYLDKGKNDRVKFDTIITLIMDSQRNGKHLVNGYYFVEETAILWNYKNGQWTQLTNPPKENMIFTNSLPDEGQVNTLYITKENIYQWDSTNNEYIPMGGNGGSVELQWKPIE